MEREQSYKDAADHYEKAWKHENQASAQVGGGADSELWTEVVTWFNGGAGSLSSRRCLIIISPTNYALKQVGYKLAFNYLKAKR